MTINEFLSLYKQAFGGDAPLPVAFGYSNTAVTDVKKIPRCMIGAIRKVCDGGALTLSAGERTSALIFSRSVLSRPRTGCAQKLPWGCARYFRWACLHSEEFCSY